MGTILLSIVTLNAASSKRSRSMSKRAMRSFVTSKAGFQEFVNEIKAAFKNNYFKFVMGVLSEPFPEIVKIYSQVDQASSVVAPCFNAFSDNTPEPSLSDKVFGAMIGFAQKAYRWKDAIINSGACVKGLFQTNASLSAVKGAMLQYFDASNILLQAGKIALNVVGNVFTFGILGATKGTVTLVQLTDQVATFWKNMAAWKSNGRIAFEIGAIVGKCIYMVLAFLGVV